MKAVIFGANGQDGIYLTSLLNKSGVEVIPVSRKGNNLIADVGDYKAVERIVSENKPDFIFHFAANSTTRHYALFENHAAISTGSLNILESAKLHSKHSKIFFSGSAMQFKNEGIPINEFTQFEASSAYSVARIHSVYAARYYREYFGLKVYVGYFFNHDSPLRSENHVNQKIVKAALRIAGGSSEILELGNISIKKEFNYAGDAVNAVWLLVNQNTVFEAIIGSGKSYRIGEWVEYCFKKINRNWRDFVVVKENFIPEYAELISDSSLIKKLGWKPQVDFFELADMMMESK